MDYNSADNNRTIFNNAIGVNDDARAQLLEMAKWTRFLAIAHFILIGFMLVGGFVAGAMLNQLSETQGTPLPKIGALGFFLIYALVAAVIIYPFIAMLRYSNGVRRALHSNDEFELAAAFRNLKRVFKYSGILLIITLSIYGLVFLMAGLGALVRN